MLGSRSIHAAPRPSGARRGGRAPARASRLDFRDGDVCQGEGQFEQVHGVVDLGTTQAMTCSPDAWACAMRCFVWASGWGDPGQRAIGSASTSASSVRWPTARRRAQSSRAVVRPARHPARPPRSAPPRRRRQQRRQQRRLVRGVAGAGQSCALSSTQRARVGLVADLVGHEAEDALGVELELEGQIIDGARLRGDRRDERRQAGAQRATGDEADATEPDGLEERARRYQPVSAAGPSSRFQCLPLPAPRGCRRTIAAAPVDARPRITATSAPRRSSGLRSR